MSSGWHGTCYISDVLAIFPMLGRAHQQIMKSILEVKAEAIAAQLTSNKGARLSADNGKAITKTIYDDASLDPSDKLAAIQELANLSALNQALERYGLIKADARTRPALYAQIGNILGI